MRQIAQGNTPSDQRSKNKLTQSALNNSGGEEVLLDVGGQDGTEAFEDVGHSDEAREILDGLLVGKLKRMVRQTTKSQLARQVRSLTLTQFHQPGDPAPRSQPQSSSGPSGSGDSAGMGVGLYGIVLVGGLIAYFAYQYLQNASAAETQ